MKKSKDTVNEKRLEQLLEQKRNESEALKKLLKAFDGDKTKKESVEKKRWRSDYEYSKQKPLGQVCHLCGIKLMLTQYYFLWKKDYV